MKHGIKQRKFGRITKQRTALLRSLAIALFTYEKIETTGAKAKELRSYAEKLITKAKTDSVFSRRILISKIGGSNKDIVHKLVNDIAPRYKERKGGYTRITKIPSRVSDSSTMAIIELV